MGKLIDADVLKSHYSWWRDDDEYKHIFNAIVDTQQEAVVRCKECKNYLSRYSGWHCYLDGRQTTDNDYCSWGERREDVIK